ncbi:hypothetical protein F0562_028168 [Nyssa sinensis]|uniref:Uncharacterized protein n=1 Tax=Nyssa sinensis TaxID=561372 RepID=A0A5J5B7I5_9ASTE|nr:hypothetical protein F0562_028168 [Nyssa sinensis]
MLGFAVLILFFSGFLEFPSVSSSISSAKDAGLYSKSSPDPFRDLLGAFKKWDSQVGCSQFREKHQELKNGSSSSSSLQDVDGELDCRKLKINHVSVLVKGWTWIPNNLDNLYPCRCGLSCLWTKSSVLADKPDVFLFETTTPPLQVAIGARLEFHNICEGLRWMRWSLLSEKSSIDQPSAANHEVRRQSKTWRMMGHPTQECWNHLVIQLKGQISSRQLILWKKMGPKEKGGLGHVNLGFLGQVSMEIVKEPDTL